jgi:N-acetylglucosamine-6-phosphate deacetylase
MSLSLAGRLILPDRIVGLDANRGSLALGKYADVLILDETLHLQEVWIAGKRVVG